MFEKDGTSGSLQTETEEIKHTRKRLHEILEKAGPGDKGSRIADIIIISLILLNTVALIVESVHDIYVEYQIWFDSFEFVSVAIFTIEYVLRLWVCTVSPKYKAPIRGRLRYAVSPLALIDLIAILPFFLPLLGLDFRSLRIARLFRTLRLAKLGRYSDAAHIIAKVVAGKREEMTITATIMAGLLIISSTCIYFVEHDAQPEVFSSIPAAMWWGAATLTTVGYGDVTPITSIGKLLGAFIAILGIAMFALPASIIGSGFVDELQARREGIAVCPQCGLKLDTARGGGEE